VIHARRRIAPETPPGVVRTEGRPEKPVGRTAVVTRSQPPRCVSLLLHHVVFRAAQLLHRQRDTKWYTQRAGKHRGERCQALTDGVNQGSQAFAADRACGSATCHAQLRGQAIPRGLKGGVPPSPLVPTSNSTSTFATRSTNESSLLCARASAPPHTDCTMPAQDAWLDRSCAAFAR